MLTLTPSELQLLTGYKRPAEQLAELHRRGFSRAYRNRLGVIVLERSHYDAVTRGAIVAPRPKLRRVPA
jgi:hypothetical protein